MVQVRTPAGARQYSTGCPPSHWAHRWLLEGIRPLIDRLAFEDDDYYTGPRLTPELVERAERSLGVRLPEAYVKLLEIRNGGVPRRRCVATKFPTSWAPDHFEIRAILGVGGPRGVDAGEGRGCADLIAEWGYPDIGVVICDMPSGGHDAVMLDYSACGPRGAPAVSYVDEDRLPQPIAASFDEFLAQLQECPDETS